MESTTEKKEQVTRKESILTKHEVSVKACPVKHVTVFMDRAEVNRVIEVETNIGDMEVLVTDLASVVDKDSVRVKCFGEATIVEVAYQEKAVSQKTSSEEEKKQITSQEDQIKKTIKELEKEQSQLKERIKITENEKKLLEEFAKCVNTSKEDKVVDILADKNVQNFMTFLSTYQDKSQKLSDDLLTFNEELQHNNDEIDVQLENLMRVNPNANIVKTARNVSILLDVRKGGKVFLVVSYVVSNASWTPLYDVRAFNKDSSVQILYFATIKQNSGEDWEDAKLSLSTAMPSVGGSPPELKTQIIDEAPRICRKGEILQMNLAYSAPRSKARSFKKAAFSAEDFESDSEYEADLPIAMTNEGLTSTSFEIARSATIQSDNVGHKVSICQLDFSPQFEYISTPKAVSHAFLKIKTKNDSTYAMLAGDANVFLDNNFLTKSSLPAVSPLEEFEIALGVDPAVKVTYKPLKKFQQTSGVISKSTVFTYHQQIEIKNTKPNPIKIQVTDQCPKSVNDKIKVLLQEPEIKLPKGFSVNEPQVITNGNASFHTQDYKIDWTYQIDASKTKTIDLRYQVEHPVGMKINVQ